MPKLHPAQAEKLAAGEARYAECKRAFDDAKKERAELRERYRDRLPLGEWVTAGKWHFRRIEKSTGERFSLREFILAGNKVTAAMRPFVSPAGKYEDLHMKPRS